MFKSGLAGIFSEAAGQPEKESMMDTEEKKFVKQDMFYILGDGWVHPFSRHETEGQVLQRSGQSTGLGYYFSWDDGKYSATHLESGKAVSPPTVSEERIQAFLRSIAPLTDWNQRETDLRADPQLAQKVSHAWAQTDKRGEINDDNSQ